MGNMMDILATLKDGKINIISGKLRLQAILDKYGSANILLDGKKVKVLCNQNNEIIVSK